MNFAYEYCPYCEGEVTLKNKFEVQTCPSCGHTIKPCSICFGHQCSKCPLND